MNVLFIVSNRQATVSIGNREYDFLVVAVDSESYNCSIYLLQLCIIIKEVYIVAHVIVIRIITMADFKYMKNI